MNLQTDLMRDAFVNAMRQVASSVTIVTTNGAAGRHGATVSAFSSVSADPPSVLVCLRTDSRIAKAVMTNGFYCVNVLPDTAQKAAIRFSGTLDADLKDRFDGLKLEGALEQCPVIPGATTFHCEVADIVLRGTHQIMIGRVQRTNCGQSPPLAWMDGQFHHIQPLQK